MSEYRVVKNNDPDLKGWHKRALKYIIQYRMDWGDGDVRWMNDGYARSIQDADAEIKRRLARSVARKELRNNPEVVRVY